jgi:hypothetical protein
VININLLCSIGILKSFVTLFYWCSLTILLLCFNGVRWCLLLCFNGVYWHSLLWSSGAYQNSLLRSISSYQSSLLCSIGSYQGSLLHSCGVHQCSSTLLGVLLLLVGTPWCYVDVSWHSLVFHWGSSTLLVVVYWCLSIVGTLAFFNVFCLCSSVFLVEICCLLMFIGTLALFIVFC